MGRQQTALQNVWFQQDVTTAYTANAETVLFIQ